MRTKSDTHVSMAADFSVFTSTFTEPWLERFDYRIYKIHVFEISCWALMNLSLLNSLWCSCLNGLKWLEETRLFLFGHEHTHTHIHTHARTHACTHAKKTQNKQTKNSFSTTTAVLALIESGSVLTVSVPTSFGQHQKQVQQRWMYWNICYNNNNTGTDGCQCTNSIGANITDASTRNSFNYCVWIGTYV